MNILITGGAGFIGSHLCEFLLNNGNKITCLDNFFTGRIKNIKHLEDNPNFKVISHDITHPLRKVIKEHIDQIYNLACPASPVHYQFDPIETIKANTLGVINVLEFARLNGSRVLQASTSEIYGDPEIHPQVETYRGNVNTLGPRACFSDDTKLLTKDGWKYFNDVKMNDEILTLNSNQEIEYHKPTEVIKQKYIGELVHFKNAKIDLLVTPNHKMYTKKRNSKKFELISAFESINWERAEMKKSATWKGKEIKYFYFQKAKNAKSPFIEKINMDIWLEFFGYYITEGCVHIRKRKREIKGKIYDTKDYNILIAQDRKNRKERERIKRCLQRTGFKFYESDDHQFRICNKHLAEYLLIFGKAKEKYIPTELKNLSKRQLKILFESLMLGDGSKDRVFYSSSKRLIEDFQEIFLKLGMAPGAILEDKRKSNIVYACYILTDKKKDFLTPRYPKRGIEKYEGFVYCVNVPNHIIYVKRNEKSLFCGNCYDEGKRVAETLFMDYHRKYNLDIRIVRIFNTYGPRMAENDGRVISNFIVQALKNKNITVFGDGSQTRSFCYVKDLVEGLYKMMNQDYIGPINLGNTNETTIIEIAKKIISYTKSSSKIIFNLLPEDDPKQRKPDISLAKENLNWAPKISFEEGIKKTIEYFKPSLS